VRTDVEIIGAREAIADLSGVAERAGDPRPALRDVREILAGGIAKQFASKGGHLGTPWPANKPGTLARKARLGQGAETLTASGALGTALGGGRGKRHRITRASVSVGVSGDLWYGQFAQTGTKRAPERKIVGISKADNARAVRRVERYIITGRMA
jgi:hypothetical protein